MGTPLVLAARDSHTAGEEGLHLVADSRPGYTVVDSLVDAVLAQEAAGSSWWRGSRDDPSAGLQAVV